MMMWTGLKMKGRHHSGIADTRNLVRASQFLIEKGFTFSRDMIYDPYKGIEPLF